MGEVALARPAHFRDRIFIKSINFSSPGKIEFEGFSGAIEAVDKIIGRLIKLVTERKIRKENDKQAMERTKLLETQVLLEKQKLDLHDSDIAKRNAEVLQMQIKSARDALKLSEEWVTIGKKLSPADRAIILSLIKDQEDLFSFIETGRITDSSADT